MNHQEEFHDDYIKSLIQEGGVSEPSRDFTNNLIESIKTRPAQSAYAYKPVISRSAWLAIALIGCAAFAYMFFVSPENGQGLNIYGYSLSLDFSKLKGIASQMAISFELTPILKTSLAALFIFTFSNLIIFELKNRSILK